MSKSEIRKDQFQNLSPLQRATLALKKLETKLNQTYHEPIAIIGIGCSFPGGATDPERFWELLKNGINTRTEIPQDRWDVDAYYDSDPEAPGKMLTRYGHFVTDVEQFDPGFFGISPREARAMDPQHRLLLEVSWQALERAGQVPERLSGAPVGVFIGTNAHDYEQLLQQHLHQEPDSPLATYSSTGIHPSSAAGRLAFTFGFTGPALTLDTACSASLVALHQACNSLRLGECQMALTGGVLLNLTPETYIATSSAKMLSTDGQCKAFDATADGYGRGEGCGMVVLKRLSQAQKDRDPILALIRGSAVNQDGPSSGLTVPNGQAQQQLLKQALAQAQVQPSDLSYLEAHGTGTALGDPIEVNAAVAVLGKDRQAEQPLWIGSVKTNIGHLEAAAGISGLIKIVLALQHQHIPAHLHLQEPNPKIDWQPWLHVPQALTPWTVSGRRLAGVSSFGFTGTNAHVVLEEAPATPTSPAPEWERPLHLLKLSAKSEQALAELAQHYSQHLDTHPEQSLGDICFTANSGRLSYSHRLSIVAETKAELQARLDAFSQGEDSIGLASGIVSGGESPKVAFLFTGQGSQYVGMGRQLYDTQPTFKQALDQCAEILQTYLDRPLLDLLYATDADDSILAQTAYTQPALFALEYALSQLWRAWGIQPSLVMGHSVGEYVAACMAGVFSLEDGLKLIATRGRLMQQLPLGGAMVSLMASADQVRALIDSDSSVAIAAINGPESTVISGPEAVLNTLVAKFEALGIKTKLLQVSHAFHSPLMEPMLAEFKQVAQQVAYAPPRLKLISNVTGQLVGQEVATPDYWCDHILAPVNFAAGMESLQQQRCTIFLECGPRPILLGMAQQCLSVSESNCTWLPSLRLGQPDWLPLLSSLSQLYVQGAHVDWLAFDQDYPYRRRLILPTYPFQKQRFWVDTLSLKTSRQEVDLANQTQVVNLISKGNITELAKLLGQDSQQPIDICTLEQLAQLHQQQLAPFLEYENSQLKNLSEQQNLQKQKEPKDFKQLPLQKTSAIDRSLILYDSENLLTAAPKDRKKLLTNYLQHRVARVLELKDEQLLAVDQDLLSVGMDSLMMMQIVAQIKKELKLTVPVRNLFEKPQIDQIVEYLEFELSQYKPLVLSSSSLTAENNFENLDTSSNLLNNIANEKLEEFKIKLSEIDKRILSEFPIERHCERFKSLPITQYYAFIPSELEQKIDIIRQKYNQETVALYQKATLAFFLKNASSSFQNNYFSLDVKSGYRQYFECVLQDFDSQDNNYYRYSNNYFLLDLNICSLRMFPVGEILTEITKVRRRTFLRIVRNGGLNQGSLNKLIKLSKFFLTEIKGDTLFYEVHIDTRRLEQFNPEGWHKFYIRIAEMLKINPHIQGILGQSWLHDPHLADISPELLYLREIPEQAGAKVFRIGTVSVDVPHAIAVSQKRKKLYEEGKYVPTSYMLIWLRDDLLKWASKF